MFVTKDIKYVGVNDHEIDLFEGQYAVKNGMAYNSYIIDDEKIAVLDTVDAKFTHQWLDNIGSVLGNRKPSYLVIHHMEPDHSANIANFMKVYPDTAIVASDKAFTMMKNFFGRDLTDYRIMVRDGNTLPLGKHTLVFRSAPMVHWPEVMVSYDTCDKVLFSADAFGKFGALDVKEDWLMEARRYYIGIVGKYGTQVRALLEKASELEIDKICSLHGPVLTENIPYYLGLYSKWASYEPEEDGVVIAYTSVYGNTKKAALTLANKLKANGCPNVAVYDLARSDMSLAVSEAFRYSKLVLATTTYNAEIYPFMHTYIEALTERNFQNRTVAFIENGSWAPMAKSLMKKLFEKSKNIRYTENNVTIKSALNDESNKALEALASELSVEYLAKDSKKANKNDMKALFNIGYGLYVVTTNDGKKDNGLIVNTISQLTSSPYLVSVTINKDNYSHHVIEQTGIMNVNCLSIDAPFSVFENYGFRSGRTADKFEGVEELRSDNGLRFLPMYINSFMSLKVEDYIDLGTHGMFICSVTESRVISKVETMSYAYYHKNVKPKPKIEAKKGFVCKICGYVYEGDELPSDFICPICKHGAADFEPIG